MSEQPEPTRMIDWDLAVKVGSRMAGDGPSITPAEADAAVAELRAGADRSTGLVRDFTGLDATHGTAPVLVVDRPGWVRANADAFSSILTPLVDRVTAAKAPGPLGQAIGARVTGTEVGLLLGFLGSKVLGQFDPFHDPAGRLLLVAPNVVHVERELEADPTDFRLWVCLHEETHRVQFTAVPWMREHLRSEIADLTDSVEPTRFLEDGLARVADAVKGGMSGAGSLIDVLSTPEQREVIDRITAVMSLLEGHADVVMDGVGPEVIPSVASIRQKFNRRRKGMGSLDRMVRRLLGLEAKMAQYRDGAVFVRDVVDKVGMDGFNAVWATPLNLPSKDEVHDPAAWVTRVHG
jgi:coenzyme F420 biosynthesis associated uncharacterized protein